MRQALSENSYEEVSYNQVVSIPASCLGFKLWSADFHPDWGFLWSSLVLSDKCQGTGSTKKMLGLQTPAIQE
jgi:hypothetical protein